MIEDRVNIGLIGAGLMGHGIGKNLIEKGFPLTVLGHRNRAPVEHLLSRGAIEAKNVSEITGRSEIILLCVTGSRQVEELFLKEEGILSSCREGLIVVDTSTSEPASTLRLAEALARLGGHLVDAPLTRTPVEAAAGKLNTIVGATPELFARLQPVFQAYCENVFHAGPLGSGHRLKLINNFLVTGSVALVAEALVTATRTGVDLGKLYEVVSAGPLASALLRNVIPKAAAGEFDGMKFQLANAQKDVRYYTNLTSDAGVTSLMGGLVHQIYTQAVALGFGDHFLPALIEVQASLNKERM